MTQVVVEFAAHRLFMNLSEAVRRGYIRFNDHKEIYEPRGLPFPGEPEAVRVEIRRQ